MTKGVSGPEGLSALGADYAADLTLTTAVCVIGTGVGGAVLASELAEAGLRVVMLEKGGHYTRRDFNQREADMMPLLYADGGARTTRDGGIVLLHGESVGGGTTVNWGICFDPPADVLKVWGDRHGVDGIGFDVLKPYLGKVRHILNVQRIRAEEVNRNNRLLLSGARALGWHADTFEHNRTGCLQSGFCMLGCAYDRKQGMGITYVPRALHFGARLLPRAEVTGFVNEGNRVVGAAGVLTNSKNGRQFRLRVQAQAFVVAAGAIGTPALLRGAGIWDTGNQLGQNLCIHPTTALLALFDEAVRGHEGIHYSAYCGEFHDQGIVLEGMFAYPGLLGSALFRSGAEAQRILTRYNDAAIAIVLLHDDGRGSVMPGSDGRPVIDYVVSAGDQAKLRQGMKSLARLYFAAGASEVLIPHLEPVMLRSVQELDRIDTLSLRPNDLALFSAHQMGTAAMGADVDGSATDSDGRLHGWQNLYVCDGSLFPSSIGVNPQITIATLATRMGDRLTRILKGQTNGRA